MNDLFTESGVKIEKGAIEKDPRFLLKSITVYNWGSFSGLQRPAEIHEEGTAIIGATGSGKTTLVDALMTLLVTSPRYNFASTGGHDTNDRSLVSYVRGVTGVESAAGNNDNVMRSGKTVTAICATYSDGSVTIKIGGLLWFEGSGNATSDLKKKWFVIKDYEEDLSDILRLFDAGGSRELKKYAKAMPHFEFYDSKKSYLALLRRFFEVGENAFTLLNRAAGLKQLNSIDQIFRELVLDNKPAFDDANRVADGFDTLAEIREELEQAKRQLDSLLPIEKENTTWQKNLTKINELKSYQMAVPIWYAERGVELWGTELQSFQNQLEQYQFQENELKQSVEEKSQAEKDLLAQYMKKGGAAIEEIKNQVKSDQIILSQVSRQASEYREIASQLVLKNATSATEFEDNAQQLEKLLELGEQRKIEINDERVSLGVENKHLADRFNHLTDEIEEVENRPKSNIHPKDQYFRDALADQLKIDAEELPFVAEMIEVKPDERAWAGAIERAIGSERLRVLVPHSRMDEALSWVNDRDNKVHVRLLRVEENYYPKRLHEDSFIHKLNIKDHIHSDALKDVLTRQDRHCVGSVAELREIEHGMTVEGTMSGRAGKFEKQDQRSIKDGWVTGFDNQHQLAQLKAEKARVEQMLESPLKKETSLKQQFSENEQQLDLIKNLRHYDFDRIDVAPIQHKVTVGEKRLAEFDRPDSDVAVAKAAYESTVKELEALRSEIVALSAEKARSEVSMKRVSDHHEQAQEMAINGLSEKISSQLIKKLNLKQPEQANHIGKEMQQALDGLQQSLQDCERKIQQSRESLGKLMEKAKQVDNGALAEAGTDLSDIEDYLKQLNFLRKEDLPKRQSKFLEYLNNSSNQSVTQLLSKIDNQVSQIKDRIDQLNSTLGIVEYKQGKYLMLEASEVSSDTLKKLKNAEKRLILAKLQDDHGESHYVALRALVEILRECANNRRNRGSLSLLDPRYRLEFFVREVDRVTHEKSGRIAGSQTGSGGEKEMMASYILTASLSYALCPKGSTQPRYATIVLDEAFSKSSQSAASKIIQALREFGLHPLFVTPNKEMSLLRSNTRSAILVHNATLTSLTWRELDEIQESQQRV
jgi:uncharacterized protein YPO0396